MPTKTVKHPSGDVIMFDTKWHSFTSLKHPRKKFTSWTKFSKDFFTPFDRDGISSRYAAKNNMKQADVLAMWDRKGFIGRESGTLIHTFMEDLLNGKEPGPLYHTDQDVIDVAKSKLASTKKAGQFILENYEIVGIEEIIASLDFWMGGIIDIRAINKKTGAPAIIDTKATADIKMTNRWQCGRGVISHLDDCDFVKNSLQINLYQKICTTGGYIKPDEYAGSDIERAILHIRADDYSFIPVPDLQEEIDHMLEAAVSRAA